MGPAETARRADGSYHSVLPIGRATVGDLEVLQGLAAELASVVDARPRLAARAERLARRLAEGRFHVVVLGEFNRGKSTLVKWAWCRSPRSSPRSPMANPIEGTADAAMSSAKVVGGVLADRPGVDRKELTAAGYGITALGHGAFAFANAWPFVAIARAVSWTARGGKAPARDSLLSGSVPHHQLGRAFGVERAMDSLGAIAGPLIAAPLLLAIGYRWLFAVSVIPGLLAATTRAGSAATRSAGRADL